MRPASADAARLVAWSGVGFNLRTGRPSPAKIRGAVRQALDEPSFREPSRALQGEMATYDAVTTIADTLEQVAGGRPSSSSRG
jgi:UDP:flavonoid glycosyltransferase YjiC (YdhE family)